MFPRSGASDFTGAVFVGTLWNRAPASDKDCQADTAGPATLSAEYLLLFHHMGFLLLGFPVSPTSCNTEQSGQKPKVSLYLLPVNLDKNPVASVFLSASQLQSFPEPPAFAHTRQPRHKTGGGAKW